VSLSHHATDIAGGACWDVCFALCREEVARAVGMRHFTFSLLVHSDASSPMVDWSQNSSILQVSGWGWQCCCAGDWQLHQQGGVMCCRGPDRGS